MNLFSKTLATGLLVLTVNSQAGAQSLSEIFGEDALQDPAPASEAAPRTKKKEKSGPSNASLKDEAALLEMEATATEADTLAYEDFINNTKQETAALNSEIASLERSVKSLKRGAERSKKEALLARKRLDLRARQKADAKRKLAILESQKRKQDRTVKALRSRTESLESQLRSARERTRQLQSAVRLAERERLQYERRQKRLKAQLDVEKRRQKALREKRTRVSSL